jgi:hypothetical protein
MGAWDIGIFDNDTAADWAVNLSHSTGLSLIEETIDAALAAGDEYLDADLACEVLAAADVVARLRGCWGARTIYSEPADRWVDSVTLEVPESLIERALSAVDRVLAPNSELDELFAESEEYEGWRAVVADLQQRIGA